MVKTPHVYSLAGADFFCGFVAPAKRIAFCMSGILLCLLLRSSAFALAAGTDVFLPVDGAEAKATGSPLCTNVAIYNLDATPANVQLLLMKYGKPNPAPAVFNDVISPGEERHYDNLMKVIFGEGGRGVLRVLSDRRLVVTANSSSNDSPRENTGAAAPALAAVPANFAMAAGQSSLLGGDHPPVYQDSLRFDFVEASGRAALIRIIAADTHQAVIRSKEISLRGYEAVQYDLKKDLLADLDGAGLRLKVEVLSGDGKVVVFGAPIPDLTLPYAGSAAATDKAVFDITNSGTGGGEIAMHGVAGFTSTGISLIKPTVGIWGENVGNGYGVRGTSKKGAGGFFESSEDSAVNATSASGTGGYFKSTSGPAAIWGDHSGAGFGVHATSQNGTAGYFESAVPLNAAGYATLVLKNTGGGPLIVGLNNNPKAGLYGESFSVDSKAHLIAGPIEGRAFNSGIGVTGTSSVSIGGRFYTDSSSSPAEIVENTGGGDLFQGFNALYDSGPAPVFRIANNGDVYVRGKLLAPSTSPAPTGKKYCAASVDPPSTSPLSACVAKCGSGKVLGAMASPCVISGDSGVCQLNSIPGSCCVCAP
jgi:hypothetical protein